MSRICIPVRDLSLRTLIRISSCFAIFLLATTSQATTYTVNTTCDGTDKTPLGDGVVDIDLSAPMNQVSLRGAIQDANSLAGSHTINIPAGTFYLFLNPMGVDDDVAAVGDLDIFANKTITITGAGETSTIIKGFNSGSIGCSAAISPFSTNFFHLLANTSSGANLTIQDLTLAGTKTAAPYQGKTFVLDGTATASSTLVFKNGTAKNFLAYVESNGDRSVKWLLAGGGRLGEISAWEISSRRAAWLRGMCVRRGGGMWRSSGGGGSGWRVGRRAG